MPPEADLLAAFSKREVHWFKSYRIVPSRFPPIDLFEGIAGRAEDLQTLGALEGLTSNRLREAAGEIHLIAEQDHRFGPGYTPVMAAFTYPAASRFSDGSYGVYYCAQYEHTAVAETRHHRERFLRESSEPPINLEMRVYQAELKASLLDLCTPMSEPYLNPDDWRPSQRLGLQARQENLYGLVYPSVRDTDRSLCAGILRPSALGPTKQGRHLQYRWDGERTTDIIELRATGY